jgi:transcriptional regulator with XRE-family HTH domain
MRRRNVIIGRRVVRLRFERNWTQEILAARLQCEGVNVSRLMVAKIELGYNKVNEDLILGLQKVFRVPIIQLFPKEIQDLDEIFAARTAGKPLKSRSRHAKG